jgi:hypothetical protein
MSGTPQVTYAVDFGGRQQAGSAGTNSGACLRRSRAIGDRLHALQPSAMRSVPIASAISAATRGRDRALGRTGVRL